MILDVLYKHYFLNPDIKTENFGNTQIKFGDVDFSITKTSLLIIDSFVKDYFKLGMNSYHSELNAFLSKYAKESATKIIDFQTQYNKSHENLLTSNWTSVQVEEINKKEIYNKLSKKAEMAALKNAFTFIINPIIKSFEEYFISLYMKGLQHKLFI